MSHRHLSFLLLGALILRLGVAYFSSGFNHPDEHFQILEPAYGLIHGHWLPSWEWDRGIRSWFAPGIFAALIGFLKFLGITQPETVGAFIRMTVGFFSISTVWATHQIALKVSGQRAAAAAAGLVAIEWVFLYFGVHPLSETLSMSLILPALALIMRTELHSREIFVSALLCVLAFAFRFQSGFFVISAFLILLEKRAPQHAVLFCTVVLAGLLGIGFLDQLTWNKFFHSAIEYFRFNILEGGAQQYGVAPWHRYLTALNRYFTAPVAILLIFLCALSLRKSNADRPKLWPLLIAILPYWGVHQLIAHKEDRFLLPLLPLLIVWASAGWASLKNPEKTVLVRKISVRDWLLLILLMAANGYGIFHHKWKWNSDVTNLYVQMGRKEDLKGLLVCGVSLDKTGGYFYLNSSKPFKVLPTLDSCPLGEVPHKYNYLILGGNAGENGVHSPPLASKLKHCQPVPDMGPSSSSYRCDELGDDLDLQPLALEKHS